MKTAPNQAKKSNVPFDKSKIPHKPGVYLFKDETGNILYVGKAIDLFNRVSSYFNDKNPHPKTVALVERIISCETIEVGSEIEALILEANLIKKYKPPYNIKLTDDKDFLYILITKEPFAKIVTGRKKDLENSQEYFGPFPSATVVKSTLKKLRRLFPWCSNPPKFNVDSQRSGANNRAGLLGNEISVKTRLKPCFYYHLKLCPGACAGKINRKDYQKIIGHFSKFMQGKKDELIKSLTQEMQEYASSEQFENAARIKKIIQGVDYILQPTKVEIYLQNPNFIADETNQGLDELRKYLNLPKNPERVECYDISNIQGKFAVGAMTVLTHGDIDKRSYRKFKIIKDGKPNDFAMMAEIVRRRVKHKEWHQPDLILIDGGRGQVRAAKQEFDKADWNIPIFGLAKRMEWLYLPDEKILKLPKSTLALRLLQKIRDEAHRFAITYHRSLRNKNAYSGIVS